MKKFFNLLLGTFVGLPGLAFAQTPSKVNVLGNFSQFLPLVFIIVFFYLFLIRPQQKKAKEHQKSLSALKKGDSVITSGGIYATVNAVRNNVVDIKIANDVIIQVSKQSIVTILTKEFEGQTKIPEIAKK